MTLTFVVSSFSLLVSQAHAASLAQPKKTPLAHHTKMPPHHPYLAPLRGTKAMVLSPMVSGSVPFDGTGQLPFYTYITHPITSPTCTCGKKELLVNVSSGDLIMHSVEMQIHGTAGLDLDIDAYYNSQSSNSRDLGQNWVLSVGNAVRLDLSNPTVGITYHGPSGYSAYFAYNSSTPTKYTDAPGLDATLTKNNDGTYTLSFHKTGASFLFASGSHLIAIKDKNGNTISLSLDADNDVNSITDTQSRVISFSHNTVFGVGNSPEGQITKFSDPTGRTTTYSYYNNQLTSVVDLNGKTTKYQYSGSDLIQVTDPMNNVTKIAYNGNHQVTSITEPTVNGSTGVTSFTYNSGNTVVTDQRGHKTTYNYDSAGKVVSIVNDSGITVRNQTYNNNYDGLVYTDGLTNNTTSAYDNTTTNNLISVTDGNNVVSKATYNNSSFPYYPSSTTDAQGNNTNFTYDGNGNTNGATNTSISPNVSTSEVYNSNGTVQSSTDANGHKTTYSYTNGNLTGITPPSPQHSESFGYDSLSRVTSVTDGDGNQTTYTYNRLDRITSISYKDASGNNASSITYNYDDDGNVLSVVDSVAGTTSFTYDALNRQTKKTLPDTSTISYTYDATSDLTSLTDAGGTVNYTYNNLNEMTLIDEPDTNYAGGRNSISYSYDDDYRVYDVNYGGSIDQTYTYDNGGRLTFVQMSGEYTTLDGYSYSYTIGSAYTSLKASVNATLGSASWVTSYSYDGLNRLTKATTTGAYPMVSSYSYDANGNRLSGSTTGTGASTPYSNTYQYDAANELTQVNTSTCTNDGNGNQTGCGSSYVETYNPRNQTASMSSPNGNLTHSYVGADSTQRTSTSGSYAAAYTYNVLGLGTEKTSSATIAYTRDNKGNLVSERTSNGNYYFLFDGVGSVVGLMDDNDNLVNSYVYDPYGVTEHQTGSQYNPWQFAGGYFDASTLYYKFGTRYYDRFGRWTQKDPVPSMKPYVYADDDPVNEVDPSGNVSLPPLPFTNCQVLEFALLVALVGILAASESGGLTLIFAVLGYIVAFYYFYPCINDFIHDFEKENGTDY